MGPGGIGKLEIGKVLEGLLVCEGRIGTALIGEITGGSEDSSGLVEARGGFGSLFVAGSITGGSIRLGTALLPLQPGPANDLQLIPIAGANDFTLLEVGFQAPHRASPPRLRGMISLLHANVLIAPLGFTSPTSHHVPEARHRKFSVDSSASRAINPRKSRV